jgi:eukaryotic-like serine/threonine-protein kinase
MPGYIGSRRETAKQGHAKDSPLSKAYGKSSPQAAGAQPMTFVARPSEWSRTARRMAAATPSGRYFAFLSYSHRDEKDARWLQDQLERFRVPSALVGRVTERGPVPRRLTPIFRDLHELAASDDLGQEIREAIAASRFLVVLCSPPAAQSRWTNAEIEAFKRAHPDGCVFAAILSGEPFASDLPGRESEECLPPALRFHYDRRGKRTSRRAEPLAADLRGGPDARRLGFLKLVAGLLGVGLDELVQRETLRRQRRLAIMAGGSLVGMLVATGLAVTAIQARNTASEQRREAEGLVGFMLGDLREKLEPIGRLDALDAVGARTLEYFEKQDKSELSEEALAQRSRALTMMGEIASQRGDLQGAMRRYREAMAGTAEMVRRKPDDPQTLFDHAQNVFWVGDLAQKRGDLAGAEAAMREYARLADRMIVLEPNNRKWQAEVKYAVNNLGTVLLEQRKYREASRQLERGLAMIESLAAAEPTNIEYQKSLPLSLAWLADAQFAEGKIDEAIAKRERQVALLNQLASKTGDVEFREDSVPARRALGRWLASRGSVAEGLQHARLSVSTAERLMETEPANMQWVEYAANSRFELAAILLADGQVADAARETRAGCDLSARLTARDRLLVEWRRLAALCLSRRAEVARESGARAEALSLALRALGASRSLRSGDAVDDRLTLAAAYKLLGDIQAAGGDRAGAQQSWKAGLAVWPSAPLNPRQLALRGDLLAAVGRPAEAGAIRQRLELIGYRKYI